FDGRHDMQALATAGLDEWMVAQAFELFLEFERELCNQRELETLRRVEIIDDVIGLITMGRTRVDLVEFYACQIGQPDERCLFCGDDVVFSGCAERDVLNPIGRSVWSVLLNERFRVNSVRKTHQREGPTSGMRKEGRRDSQIVVDQLSFGDLIGGKENF